jgi:hypothetical protein
MIEKWSWLTKQPQTPPRRLREHKGVTFNSTSPGLWYYGSVGYNNVAVLIANNLKAFTDDDHAALLALRDDPEETLETLEEVIHEWSNAGPVLSNYRIGDLCYRIRAWLATQPQTITPEQAVKVLVENGARRASAKHAAMDSYEYAPVLILPTTTPESGK